LESAVVLVDPLLVERVDGTIAGAEGLGPELPLVCNVVKLDAINYVVG
jgi:hypothetical protein